MTAPELPGVARPHLHAVGGPLEARLANARVFTCQRVAGAAPVLYVSHDDNGDWQFLCGDVHGDGGADGAVVSCAGGFLVEREPTLEALADLCLNHEARRTGLRQSWSVTDLGEAFIQEWVRKLGWAVQMVGEGDGGSRPPFAYTVGLTASFGHPELIVVGQKPDLMKVMLNECGGRVKEGIRLQPGMRLDDVIDGFQVEVRTLEPEVLRFLGYARWFYGGVPFEALQIVWPNFEGRFPGDPAVDAWATDLQRLT